LVPQLTEGMNWSEGRHYVAKALLSVRDLKRQIPWAQRRWKRLQREAAKERKILARLFEVGAMKDRAPSHCPKIWPRKRHSKPFSALTLPDRARSFQHAAEIAGKLLAMGCEAIVTRKASASQRGCPAASCPETHSLLSAWTMMQERCATCSRLLPHKIARLVPQKITKPKGHRMTRRQ
jgi:hypothetical protein